MQSEVRTVVAHLLTHSPTAEHVRLQLADHTAGMPADEEVAALADILQHVLSQGEGHNVVAAVAWERLNAGERWRASFQSLDDMRSHFQWGSELEKMFARFVAHEHLRMSTDAAVQSFWRCSLESVFPSGCEPGASKYSKHFLNHVKTLVGISCRSQALECLNRARQERRRSTRSRNGTGFIPVDFARAIKELRETIIVNLDAPGFHRGADNWSETEEFDAFPSGGSFICSCPDDLTAPMLGLAMLTGSEKVDGLCRTLRQRRTQLCHHHLRGVMGKELGMCTNQTHAELLRRLDTYLQARDRGTEDALRQRRHGWFQGGGKAAAANVELGMWKYVPQAKVVASDISFNPRAIFRRHGMGAMYEKWLVDGTVILDGVFNYIMCNEETLGLIEREFDLYKYHTREEMNGKKRNGWIRTMFYSAIQQLVRQDPVYYALNVAARPDLNWRLVSYPYYTKDTSAGENTGFKHLDLNVPELLAEGRGENIIQSSVSIDDEYEDGCTIVVPGFQRNIREWWGRVEARGMTANGPTTGVAKTYTKDDERVFGAFIPTPCRRGGIRITRPEILHGSTPYCRTRRRTILPCFIAVSEDHHSLENSKCESWAELSACHREMEAPKRSTSGFGFAYGGPGFRFPATVQLASSSALGDAIVCGRRWDDPLVLGELKILLGACEKNAMHYVESCRRRLVENYITAAKAVFEIERVAYGNRSFSRRDSLPDAHACEDDTYSTLGLSDYSCDGASRGD